VLKWETLAVTGAKIVQVFGGGGGRSLQGQPDASQRGMELKWETLTVTGAKAVQVFGGGEVYRDRYMKEGVRAKMGEIICYRGENSAGIWGGGSLQGPPDASRRGVGAEMGDVNCYRGESSAGIWWGEFSRDNQIEGGGGR
jgi:hypothetical protein